MIKGFQDQKSSRTWVFFVERYDSNIIENESILVTFLTISFNQKACVENVDFSKIPNSKIIERWSYDEANTLPQRFVGRHVSNVPSVVFSCGFRWCHSGEVFLFPFRHGIPDRLVTSNGPGQLSWRRFFSKRDPSPKPVETCGMRVQHVPFGRQADKPHSTVGKHISPLNHDRWSWRVSREN